MVIGDLIVLPDVVGNGHVDVALAVGVIGNPPPGVRIQVQRLGFLPAIAAALPRVHGAGIASRLGGPLRFGQPTIAVAQQRPGQHGQAQVQKRKDKQLVPEDMPPVGFAVPATGGHPDVELDGVGRHCLQEMEDVDPQLERRIGGLFLLDLEVAIVPEVGPGQRVRGQEVVKTPGLAQRLLGLECGLGDGRIARGIEGHDLFDGKRVALPDRTGELLRDVIRMAVDLPLRVDQAGVVIEAGPGHFGHVQERLRGPAAQHHGLGVWLPSLKGVEVLAGQGPVARHAVIDDAAVQGGAHRQAARPVLGGDLDSEPGKMRMGHADQAPLLPTRDATLRVTEPHGAVQHTAPQVQLLAVCQDLDRVQAQPLPAVDP